MKRIVTAHARMQGGAAIVREPGYVEEKQSIVQPVTRAGDKHRGE
jgi:hypothetical protein